MSKSAGNGIDPLDMIQKYGADAVRLSLVLLTREGQDVKLSEDRFEMGKRFTNKLWNAARFTFGHLRAAPMEATSTPSALELEDRWILSRMVRVTASVQKSLDEYRFNDGANELYRFVWNDFCDWYLELVKSRLEQGGATAAAARRTLFVTLDATLRLLHPFTPFQTEVLWRALFDAVGERADGMLVTTPWPAKDANAKLDPAAEEEMGVLQELVGAVRSIRALTMTADRKPLEAHVSAPGERERRVLAASAARAKALGCLSVLEVGPTVARPPSSAVGVAAGMEVFVPLGSEVNLNELAATLTRRSEKLEKSLAAADAKLANEGFLRGAEADVVESERTRRDETARELDLLRRNLAGMA
jgi:valyl-tRNA synthetase